MEDCATHIGPLAAAIKRFGGRVLELGGGWYSSPLIHALSDEAITLETNSTWYEYLKLVIPNRFFLVKDIAEETRQRMDKQLFDVVFIDLHEGSDRVACAKIALRHPSCIVAHDSERPYWQPLLRSVKYQKHFRVLKPNTAWLSNSHAFL